MAAMTCLACNVAFEDVDLGRLHYKSDWHRYNLKRKVANLLPVTFEKFEERVLQQEKMEQESANSQETCFCKPCNKKFNTTNAFDSHMQSKKHKDVVSGKENKSKKKKKTKTGHSAVVKQPKQTAVVEKTPEEDQVMSEDDESDAESWDSYDEAVLGLEECLFCSHLSGSMEGNVDHMTLQHGFFLPDAEYVCDLEGLITYLGEKVGAGKVCLWCNEKGKRFHNTKDVQRHMVDKGHCKMLHEGDVIFEYADFYDYTTSYPDGENPDTNPDEVVSPEELESDGFSLTLPSGAQIGHRSLMRYYQQNMGAVRHDAVVRVMPRLLAKYKALGWTGATGLAMERRVKDVRFVQRMKKHYHMQLGVKANNLRHRYRNSNPI